VSLVEDLVSGVLVITEVLGSCGDAVGSLVLVVDVFSRFQLDDGWLILIGDLVLLVVQEEALRLGCRSCRHFDIVVTVDVCFHVIVDVYVGVMVDSVAAWQRICIVLFRVSVRVVTVCSFDVVSVENWSNNKPIINHK
jgi:hypothetical protein